MARSREHVIETESRRIVASSFAAERFVERDQTERDYGIDMVIEHFDAGEPSGRVLFLQIKGTDGAPPSEGQTSIPYDIAVKTLLRCERFATPILLVWVPVRDGSKRAWFLWLQTYLRIVLDHEKPDWRKQHVVRLHIPVDNLLAEPLNERKLIHIAGAPGRAAAFGQLSRLAHEARWAVDDPRTLAPIFEEALRLDPIFGDPGWRWGQDQHRVIERGLLACQIAMSGRDPTNDELKATGWFLQEPISEDKDHRWDLLAAGAEHCAQLMSTAVAIYYDDRLRHTVWDTTGDHDF